MNFINDIIKILKWLVIGMIEVFINICSFLAIAIWVIYGLNVFYYFTTEIFNYYIPSHTKTCYLLFDIEYCTDN
jgi:hypothetical protein